MTDAERECYEAAFAYAFRVYGGERGDAERARLLAQDYAAKTVAAAHGTAALARVKLEHDPAATRPKPNRDYR